MLRSMLAFTTTALLSVAALAAPVIGQSAPAFSAVDSLSGKTIQLADLKGKTVVLETTNAGCPFVEKHYSVGNMQKLQQSATADGVVWVTFNASAKGKEGYLENDAAVKELVSKQAAKASYYIRDTEGKIGRLYEAKTTPHM